MLETARMEGSFRGEGVGCGVRCVCVCVCAECYSLLVRMFARSRAFRLVSRTEAGCDQGRSKGPELARSLRMRVLSRVLILLTFLHPEVCDCKTRGALGAVGAGVFGACVGSVLPSSVVPPACR